ncbi:hypothetical protein BH23ACT8_BH23ACT8_10370 [soil metagenome]
MASGAAWVAVHHGGGVGMGNSIHTGAQVVADGPTIRRGCARGGGVGRVAASIPMAHCIEVRPPADA